MYYSNINSVNDHSDAVNDDKYTPYILENIHL
jgi:hypothetical protein